MAHLLPQPPHTSYEYGPGSWLSYHDHALDYAGDSYTYTTTHHGSYHQHPSLQYGHFNHQSYVIAQNEGSLHVPLATPDASVSYWQMTQVPTAPSGPPLQMGLPAEPIHYPPYHSQVLGTTCGTTSMMYTERPEATALTAPGPPTALPTSAQHLPIVHDQGGSGHNRIPQDVVLPSLSYEIQGSSQRHPTFQPTNPSSYAQTGLYQDAHLPAGAAPTCGYAPPLAMPITEDQQQQAYFGTSQSAPVPAADTTAQGQYGTPGPVAPPAPVPPPSTRKGEAPDRPPRAESPMAHLPYPEDVAAAAAATTNLDTADGQRQYSWPGAQRQQQQSPSPASTPAPLSPVAPVQTLTFIRYPETEPRSHRNGRARGGSGTESDDLAEDDEWSSSPSSQRRGRRGKKQPKKDPFLACFFCRGRKIACHPKNDGGEDRTCT
ncbi:hypothetical protein BC827DRAFT_1155302 [Russula dissimulans]|nr:hypothetical protein BC827DRAFT_1155302 [Russula dissimulans]